MIRFSFLCRKGFACLTGTPARLASVPVGRDARKGGAARHFAALGVSRPLRTSGGERASRALGGTAAHLSSVTEEILAAAPSAPGAASTPTTPVGAVAAPGNPYHVTASSSAASTSADSGNRSSGEGGRSSSSSTAARPDGDAPNWSTARVDALLAAHGSLGPNSLGTFASRRAAVERLTEAERGEIRDLIDFITQTVEQPTLSVKQRSLLAPTCRLAYHVGFHNRCCELFFLTVKHDTRGPAPPVTAAAAAVAVGATTTDAPATASPTEKGADGIPDYVFDAAVAGRDVPSLARCLTLARDLHASSSAARPGAWTASAGVMHAMRAYCGLVELHNLLQAEGDASAAQAVADAAVCEATVWALLALGQVGEQRAEFFAVSARRARYASDYGAHGRSSTGFHDEVSVSGRAAVCLQVFRHWCGGPRGAAAGGCATAWLTPVCLQQLLRTAIQAQRWDAAGQYVLYTDLYLRHRSAGGGTGATALLDHAEDGLVGMVLRFHLFAHQHQRGLSWLAGLRELFPGYLPTVTVGNLVARLAGAAGCEPGLALWCLELFLDSKQPTPPTPTELFDCLCVLARCGVPNFLPVVDSLVKNGLLALGEEEALYVRLLHCRGNIRWREALDGLLTAALAPAAASDGGEPASFGFSLEVPALGGADPQRVRRLFSSRNIYVALLVMQEGEHPLFLVYYRFLLLRAPPGQTSVAERARWAMFAAVWATARAGKLPAEDLLFIAREVTQLLLLAQGGVAAAGMPASVRRSLATKWAVLYAQYEEAWWARQAPGGTRHEKGKRGEETAPGVPLLAPAASERAVFPVARFLKKKSQLRLSAAPSSLFAWAAVTEQFSTFGDEPILAAARCTWHQLAARQNGSGDVVE